MRRSELEHLIRAAGRIANERELARHGMTRKKTLLERLQQTTLTPALAKIVTNRIARDFP